VKILWHSVAPWVGTGYGMQTAQATPRIQAMGHDVAISAYYGLAGALQRWRGMTVYPTYAETYGKDTLVPNALHHFGAKDGDKIGEVARRGLVITLGDVWTFAIPLLSDLNVAAWVPIDHETVPPMVEQWFGAFGAIPIAISRFGERKLADLGLDPIYVPHAIDTSIFCPGDKKEARERVGLPTDAFVVAIVAANVGQDAARKAFYEQILAFASLRKRHPDAVLALHTDISHRNGVDIPTLLSDLPSGSYVISDQYQYRIGTPASTVADIMRAADVLSNTSWGEGFGIPIVEAQACGTPVVVSQTTAMPELVGAGWLVDGEPFWHDSQKAWARRPLIGGIVDAYEQAYDRRGDEALQAQAWAFAQDYDADAVAEKYWAPALTRLEAAIDERREAASKPPAESSLRSTVKEADGFLWLDRGSRTDDWIGWTNHEDTLKPVFDELLPEGGVLLDVGAHIGRWSIRMSRRASWVFSVEPNPATRDALRRHLLLNDVRNVTVLPFAAWDSATTLRLQDDNQRLSGGSTRVEQADDNDDARVEVTAVRLDTLDPLRELDRLDMVKLDVEGADLHALRGMSGLLERFRPNLLVERHDVYFYYALDDLTGLLASLGYDWREVMYGTAPYLVCAPVPLTVET
jgi:FkbM family methyltransferase